MLLLELREWEEGALEWELVLSVDAGLGSDDVAADAAADAAVDAGGGGMTIGCSFL